MIKKQKGLLQESSYQAKVDPDLLELLGFKSKNNFRKINYINFKDQTQYIDRFFILFYYM